MVKRANVHLEVYNYSEEFIDFEVCLIVPKDLVKSGLPKKIYFAKKQTISPKSRLVVEDEIDLPNSEMTWTKLDEANYHFKDYQIRLISGDEYVDVKQR